MLDISPTLTEAAGAVVDVSFFRVVIGFMCRNVVWLLSKSVKED